MNYKTNMAVLFIVGLFLVSIFSVSGSVSSITAEVTPEKPSADEDLECTFTVSGDEADYDTTITWQKDGSDYSNEDVTATDDDETTVTLDSSETGSGEKWRCIVEAGSKSDTADQVLITTKLIISDMSVSCDPSCEEDVDEDDAMLGDAGEITELKPGTKLSITFEVESLWDEDDDDEEDMQIDDIELECKLNDIGEDDDDEKITKSFSDLDAEDKDEVTFEFTISEEAKDNENKDIDCTLTGNDDEYDYDIDFTIEVEVEKEDHDVKFIKADINPSIIACNRNFGISYKIKNLGAKDEDDVQVVIKSSSLDIYKNELIRTLEEGKYTDEDTEFSGTYSLSVDSKQRSGTYPVRFEVFFDDNDDSWFEMVNLEVQDCVAPVTPKPVTPTPTEPTTKEDVEVVTQPVIQPTQQVNPTQATAQTTTTVTEPKTQGGFTDSFGFIILLVFVVLGLFGLAIWMILILVKK
jgi:hypothetical protein